MDTSQAPQAPQPDQSAASTLGSVAGGIPLAAGAAAQQVTQAASATPSQQAAPTQPAPASGGSRLARIVQAVSSVASTALAAVPDKGRPSFVTGLGEGARAEQNAVATQNAIKFKTFDDQVRLAQLHNQDLKMQQDTQAQRDAHVKAELDNRSLANSLGIQYDTLASDGDAVMDHFKSQTAATGSASVPSGTHLSGDGESINIPKNDQATQDGQKRMYELLAPALGLSPLPPGAQFVPPKNMNMLTNKIHGYDIAGNPIKHDDLQTAIGTAQANRDQLAKNGATPQQLQAIDNMIGIYKANLNALDEHAESVRKTQKQGDLDLDNSPANVQAAANKAGQVEQAKLNVTNLPANQAAAARGEAAKTDAKNQVSTNMFSGSDANGNQVAGTMQQLQDAGITGVTKLDADTGKKVITARQLISPDGLFSLIKQDMLNLKAKGKLGSSMEARFNDALLQKAGADPDYAPLFVHTHLLSTALMQAHVGSRGSSDMMGEFQKLANAGKMDADTLRSALGAEFNYVAEKAMLPKKQPTGGQ